MSEPRSGNRRHEFTHTARLVFRRTDGGVWLAVTCGARTVGQRPCCPFPFGSLLVSDGRRDLALLKAYGTALRNLPGDDGQKHPVGPPGGAKAKAPGQPSGEPAPTWPSVYIGPWWKVNKGGEVELTTAAQRHVEMLRKQGRSLVDFEETDPPVYRRRAADRHSKIHPLRQLSPPPTPPEGYAGLLGLFQAAQPTAPTPVWEIPKPSRSIGPVTHPWHLITLIREPVFRCPVHGPNRVDALVILDEFGEIHERLEAESLKAAAISR